VKYNTRGCVALTGAAVVCLLTMAAIDGKTARGSTVAVAYDSFGPANTFNKTVGWGVSGISSSHGYRGQAQRFTPSVDGTLNTIELAIGRASGSGLSTITVVADDNGYPTGAVLETFNSVPASGTFGNSYAPRLLTSALTPFLTANSTYWLRAEPADATTSNAWNNNSRAISDRFGFSFSPGAWDALGPDFAPDSGVFRITEVVLPEPQGASLILLLFLGAEVMLLPRPRRITF